jgi:hypothetical protein
MIQLRRSFYLKALLAAPIAMMSAPTVEHEGNNSHRNNSTADSTAADTATATSPMSRTDYQEDYRDRAYRYRDHDRSYAYYGNGWAHKQEDWTMAGITSRQEEKNNGQP